MGMGRGQDGRGFTLVELLVVAAVVAMLMGLVLPALESSRRAARGSVCGSNIRQLAMASRAYAVDHGGHFVPAAEDIFEGFGGRKRWHGVRISPGVSSDPRENWFDPAKGPMAGYLGGDGKVKACPEFGGFVVEGAANAFEAGTGGYGYNATYIGGRNDLYGMSQEAARTTAREDQVSQPSRTVLFTDAGMAQREAGRGVYVTEYSFCEPPFFHLVPGPEASGMRASPSIHFRHVGRRCSVAWVDGHVEMMELARSGAGVYGVSEEENRRLGFGWFEPDSNELFDLR